ncbi:MAG: hypothetical protein WBC89_03050, partial [Dehalococcoidia bacterium]
VLLTQNLPDLFNLFILSFTRRLPLSHKGSITLKVAPSNPMINNLIMRCGLFSPNYSMATPTTVESFSDWLDWTSLC